MIQKKELPYSFSPLFEPYWFNTSVYSLHQVHTEGYFFLQQKDDAAYYIRLYYQNGKALSPWRAPFGSIEFSQNTDQNSLYEFVKELIHEVKNDGIRELEITAPPDCYNLVKADLLDECLLHAGFEASLTELNYHLPINTGNEFSAGIHDSERRRLKKCTQAGFVAGIDSTPDLYRVHGLITACRSRKGFPLSMNVEDFIKMFHLFPDQYLVFSVYDGSNLIATAIGVKVSSTILYNFLPADHQDYLSYSPMVLLNKCMYDYCMENGYEIYDLGIATAGGIRNEGLIRFKEHLGGIMSNKNTYRIKV